MKKLLLAMAIAIVTATAVSAQEEKMVIPTVQTDKDDGYDGNSATRCGILSLNFQPSLMLQKPTENSCTPS